MPTIKIIRNFFQTTTCRNTAVFAQTQPARSVWYPPFGAETLRTCSSACCTSAIPAAGFVCCERAARLFATVVER